VLRRIAADSRKVDWNADTESASTVRVFRSMGFDLGSIHAATPRAPKRILKDLDAREETWLSAAAKAGATAVAADYAQWRAATALLCPDPAITM
jgi:hypothetical protein